MFFSNFRSDHGHVMEADWSHQPLSDVIFELDGRLFDVRYRVEESVDGQERVELVFWSRALEGGHVAKR